MATLQTDRPPTQQPQPGHESKMAPKPASTDFKYHPAGKLKGKVALISGGDSGIGRATAYAFALEGADIAFAYLEESEDAEETRQWIESHGRRCVSMAGDIGDEAFCRNVVDRTVRELGRLDILVNNAAEQHEAESLLEISAEQLERTFRTNIFSQFFLTKAALPHLKKGSAIINTTSVTAYRGSDHLIDYAATKGAIVSFTRSLSKALAEKGIRVNAVAPGPVWTPLIPATFPPDRLRSFGKSVPLERAGQPEEIAPSYVFLACDDTSYMTGQVLHPNGGEVING